MIICILPRKNTNLTLVPHLLPLPQPVAVTNLTACPHAHSSRLHSTFELSYQQVRRVSGRGAVVAGVPRYLQARTCSCSWHPHMSRPPLQWSLLPADVLLCFVAVQRPVQSHHLKLCLEHTLPMFHKLHCEANNDASSQRARHVLECKCFCPSNYVSGDVCADFGNLLLKSTGQNYSAQASV